MNLEHVLGQKDEDPAQLEGIALGAVGDEKHHNDYQLDVLKYEKISI